MEKKYIDIILVAALVSGVCFVIDAIVGGFLGDLGGDLAAVAIAYALGLAYASSRTVE